MPLIFILFNIKINFLQTMSGISTQKEGSIYFTICSLVLLGLFTSCQNDLKNKEWDV
jgi:hypothetical protein